MARCFQLKIRENLSRLDLYGPIVSQVIQFHIYDQFILKTKINFENLQGSKSCILRKVALSGNN